MALAVSCGTPQANRNMFNFSIMPHTNSTNQSCVYIHSWNLTCLLSVFVHRKKAVSWINQIENRSVIWVLYQWSLAITYVCCSCMVFGLFLSPFISGFWCLHPMTQSVLWNAWTCYGIILMARPRRHRSRLFVAVNFLSPARWWRQKSH